VAQDAPLEFRLLGAFDQAPLERNAALILPAWGLAIGARSRESRPERPYLDRPGSFPRTRFNMFSFVLSREALVDPACEGNSALQDVVICFQLAHPRVCGERANP
jgi:hypothetical protein